MYLRSNKKGFTLVEVLVASALLVVLIAVAGGLIISSMNTSSRYAQMDYTKQLGLAVYDFYKNQLQDASVVAIDPASKEDISDYQDLLSDLTGLRVASRADDSGSGSGSIYLKSSGSLSFDDLYGEDIYMHLTVNTYISVAETTMNLQVDVLSDGEIAFTKKSAFRLATLKRLHKQVQNVDFGEAALVTGTDLGAADAPLVNPAIYYIP